MPEHKDIKHHIRRGKYYCYADCHNQHAEFDYAECRSAECRDASDILQKFQFTEQTKTFYLSVRSNLINIFLLYYNFS